jgi:hypothetical protein
MKMKRIKDRRKTQIQTGSSNLFRSASRRPISIQINVIFKDRKGTSNPIGVQFGTSIWWSWIERCFSVCRVFKTLPYISLVERNKEYENWGHSQTAYLRQRITCSVYSAWQSKTNVCYFLTQFSIKFNQFVLGQCVLEIFILIFFELSP